ncbi:17515_t:CDS:2, partial [Racocetra fulgida]
MLKNERTKHQRTQLEEENIASSSGNSTTENKEEKAKFFEKGEKGGKKLHNKKENEVAKILATEGLKQGSKAFVKSIPWVGNVIGAIDDIYQEIRVAKLQDTSASLKETQSTMEGNITDLQAGLKQAKDRELQLAQDYKNLQDQLNKANTETKTELELQKQALEEAISANKTEAEQIQTAITAVNTQIDEVKNRMKDSEEAIGILQNTSLSHEEKITNLNSLMEKEKERITAFETKMDSFEDQLNNQQKQLDTHQEKINQLHQAHLKLEKQ